MSDKRERGICVNQDTIDGAADDLTLLTNELSRSNNEFIEQAFDSNDGQPLDKKAIEQIARGIQHELALQGLMKSFMDLVDTSCPGVDECAVDCLKMRTHGEMIRQMAETEGKTD